VQKEIERETKRELPLGPALIQESNQKEWWYQDQEEFGVHKRVAWE